MSPIPGDHRRSTDTFHRLRSPCEVLRDDYMLPRAMTAAELACCTGLPVERIRRIIMGEPVDAECAIRFAAIFHTTALYWLVLQAEFDRERERRGYEPGEFEGC